jgi:hypothetical protein
VTYQERIVSITREAVESVVRNVRAMPEDRLTWQPAPTARTAMDIFQECAGAPGMFARILRERRSVDMTPETFGKMREERQAWNTVDKAEEVLRSRSEDLYAAILAVPDEDLGVEVRMPWGEMSPLAHVMVFHYWNLTYHFGQLAYIQRLYGDVEMH